MPDLDCLLCYMVINKHLSMKIKVLTFIHGLNRGIHSSPSEMNIRNSILQVLLAHIRLIKECVIYSFSPIFLVLFGVSYFLD